MIKLFISSLLICVSLLQISEPQGLKAGDKAPLFESKSHTGENISLSSLLKKGPVVLFFYRGEWCPYCNKQMHELQDSLLFITGKSASVVAVTPETENNIVKTIEKTNASFSIIHDEGNQIMNLYKTTFVLDSVTVEKYKKWNIDLQKANGNTDNALPVPATYVIGKDGIIKYVFFNTDYKKRANVKTLLEYL